MSDGPIVMYAEDLPTECPACQGRGFHDYDHNHASDDPGEEIGFLMVNPCCEGQGYRIYAYGKSGQIGIACYGCDQGLQLVKVANRPTKA